MKTIVKVLRELLSKTKEKKKKNKAEDLEKTTNQSSLWAIITALRGPDNDNDEELKELTTARVRGILGLERDSVNVCYEPLTDEEITQRNNLLDKRRNNPVFGDHFTEHFKNAMNGLKTLGYDVPEKELLF